MIQVHSGVLYFDFKVCNIYGKMPKPEIGLGFKFHKMIRILS